MSVNPPPPPSGRGPSTRYLDFRQSTILREVVDNLIQHARNVLVNEGADARCLDHEIGMALARAAVRLDLDLINGSNDQIQRLEAVVAEMGARLEQAKIANAIEGEGTPRIDAPSAYDIAMASYENGNAAAADHVPGANCKCRRCR